MGSSRAIEADPLVRRRLIAGGFAPPPTPRASTRNAVLLVVGSAIAASILNLALAICSPVLDPWNGWGVSGCPSGNYVLIALSVTTGAALTFAAWGLGPSSQYNGRDQTMSGWAEPSWAVHPGQDALYGRPPEGPPKAD
ncbi:MAG: hypothetical protein L3K06_07130 [Thermoplasmata archaeon]|nr:hypothetical protein [Thermoplasmata archaeon]